MGERHLEAVSQVIMTGHTGHHDPACLAPQEMWHPFGWQTKFTTHWVTHGDNHSTHILHPTLGHALVLCKKDGYQSHLSCYP